jgi:hypothetical protein
VVGDPDVVAVGFGYFHSKLPELFAQAGEELCGGSSSAMMVMLPASAGIPAAYVKPARALAAPLRSTISFCWPCGQRFPAEKAALRRLAPI